MRKVLLLLVVAASFVQAQTNVRAVVNTAVRLPNSKLTPGVSTSETKTQICSKSFHTKDVRSVSELDKNKVYMEYKVKDHEGYCSGKDGCEVDHLISLELGGANDVANLWPHPYGEHPGAHEKDILENRLHKLVCSNQVGLKDAQQQIATNWYLAYKKYVIDWKVHNTKEKAK